MMATEASAPLMGEECGATYNCCTNHNHCQVACDVPMNGGKARASGSVSPRIIRVNSTQGHRTGQVLPRALLLVQKVG